MPLISANTQARPEGYFRLEWYLAEQRSHLIARGRPFIVPVAIDETGDAESLVPDAFLAVQWMRLPRGETSPAFCARVKAYAEVHFSPEADYLRGDPRFEKLRREYLPPGAVPLRRPSLGSKS